MIEAEALKPVRVPMEVWSAWRASLSEYENRKVDHLERREYITVWRVKSVPEPFVEVEGTGVPSITSLGWADGPTWAAPESTPWQRAAMRVTLDGVPITTHVVAEPWL